jgi:WYL domain-containing protein
MSDAALRRAIKGRNVIEFHYRGRPRVAHPHALFVASTGTYCLDAVQVAGRSTSGPLPGWRRFDLESVEAVTIREDRFDIDPDFDRRARDYRKGTLLAAVDSRVG